MKVTELINQINKLGYTDKTEIYFGFLNKEEGEFYETEIIKVDDEDRECGDDCIAVTLEKPKDYIKSEVDSVNINLREELVSVVNKYLW